MTARELQRIVNEAIESAPEIVKGDCCKPWATVSEVRYVIQLHGCSKDTQLVHYIYEKLYDLNVDTTEILVLVD